MTWSKGIISRKFMVPFFLTFTSTIIKAGNMLNGIKISFVAIALLIVPLFINACGKNIPDVSDGKLQEKVYRNPVVPKSLPDPSVIKAADGLFYLYATEDIRNTPIYKSNDLVNWQFAGTAFTDETRPGFEPKGGLWAPDINYINGKYVLYYSMSVWGGEWTCGIGVASGVSPQGPFTDHGKLFRSNEIEVQNSIDPFYIEEDGKHYLFWGSFRGIYAIELTDDGLALKPGAAKQQIAGTAYEGVTIYKKDKWYYLFASIGSCCEGINSTYTAVAGRSKNLFGPYTNKSGRSMATNQHEIIIHGNDRFLGTGHTSELVEDDDGNTWVLYHAVDKNNPQGRVLMLDQIQWQNDWPFIEGNTSSKEWKLPEFGQ
jgi:arabinan endo-1,5-alpha-L-arabinosidase